MQRPLSALPARSTPRGPGFVRAALFTFWAFVLWGTLVDLGALWMLATLGPRGAWHDLQNLSAPNALLAMLALFVWLTVGWTLALGEKADH